LSGDRDGRGLMANRVWVLTAVVAVSVIAATHAAGGATGPAEIRITDVEAQHSITRPHTGVTAGTVETLVQRLYNPRLSRKPIGHATIVCTWADARDRSCVSTYVLPKGTIVAVGAVRTRLLYEQPVVGGTGLFDNARGSVTVTASHFKPRHEVLVFRLVG